MPETVRGADPARLARSCGRSADWIRLGPGAPGLERAEVHLGSVRFEPHRHDTYAICLTTAGVQTFRYRGARRVSLPGQLLVLHPDELHDGAAGTDEGFAYRALYVAPELVQEALGGAPLPFVANPVHPASTARPLAALLAEAVEPMSDVGLADAAACIADALEALAGARGAPSHRIDLAAVERARGYLEAHAPEPTPAATLERVTGLDRFTLARHFRRAFGTSPDRYRTMRRLDLARRAIERGEAPAHAAALAGFVDQSHMTRQFKRAYGITPARWAALVKAASGARPVR